MNWVVAVDLGGTMIKGALVNDKGETFAAREQPTQAFKGREYVLEERLLPFIKGLIEDSSREGLKARSIGLAVASPLNPWEGILYNPPNLPGWQVFPLLSYLQDRLPLPVYIDNDANLFALGEWLWGAGEGKTPLVCLTLGTGIGGGVVYDHGRLWHGAHGTGGELGHITIEMGGPLCNCGNRGCLEAMASATALERWVEEALNKGRPSILSPGANARDIALAAQKGDPLSLEAFKWAGRNLGVGLASLANIFDPQLMVLGGGLSRAGMLLLSPAVEEFRSRVLPLHRDNIKVKLASLGKMGGVLGAAIMALNREKSSGEGR